nr:unnamed protein product [Spirometra erinaceieuropaei]
MEREIKGLKVEMEKLRNLPRYSSEENESERTYANTASSAVSTEEKENRVGGNFLKWIENFLLGRHQVVRIGRGKSDPAVVESNVPQGSVLGPILFLIYVDDAARALDCEVAMFADDMKIWSVIRGPADEDRLQMNLNRLEEWSNSWLLRFNVAKCSILRLGKTARSASTRGYFLGGAALQEVEAQKDLGVLTTSSPPIVRGSQKTQCMYCTPSSTKDPKEIKTSAEELLAIETEIDVGTGVQLRRPFRSIQQRLSELATDVPQEVSLALISRDSNPSVTTAATTAHPLPSTSGIRPLGGCLFMTQSFTGVSALPSTADMRANITKAMQRALDSLKRHLALLIYLSASFSDFKTVAADSSMDRVVHLHVVVSANVDLSSQECFSALNQPFEAAFDTPDILRQRVGNVPPSRVCVASQWPEELMRLIQHNEPSPNCVSN